MAVPRLREQHPFRLLEPQAADRRGAARGRDDQGRAAPRPGDRPRRGAGARPGADRLGGGEPRGRAGRQGRRLLRPRVRPAARGERIDRRTVVATTVHPIQILRENLLMTAHDIPVNLVATPRAVIDVDGDVRARRAGSSGTTSSRRRSTRSRCSSATATPAEAAGSSRSRQLRASRGRGPRRLGGDLLVPGVDDRRARMPSSRARRDVHRAVVDQHVDAELDAAGDLVERAVQVVVGHADRLEPAARWRVAGVSARWLVTWIQWPASCQARTVSTASG